MLFSKSRVFVIAEIANSHEGNLATAKELTKKVSETGADAIKFQKFSADELAEPQHENYSLYKELEMKDKEWKDLIEYTKSKKLKVFADVFGVKSAKSLEKHNIDGYKIHSSDINNIHLLNFLGIRKYPILVSTGGCYDNEIDNALKILQKVNKETVMMYGFQSYPSKLSDMNLNRIPKFQKRFGYPIGIMDHISGDSKMSKIIPLLAILLGAVIVEKHITLNRENKGTDYFSALNPDEFKNMVSLIRMSEKALGSGSLSMSSSELLYRNKHKKNAIAAVFIKKGTTISKNHVDFKRTKISQKDDQDYLGKIAKTNIPKGKALIQSVLENKEQKIVAVVACRLSSTRLFAKPLQLLGEKSILESLIEQLRISEKIDDIVLAISEKPENDIFIEFAKKHKLKFIRGSEKDVLKRLIVAGEYVKADSVFRVTPDNPFTYWEGIDSLMHQHVKGNYDFSYYSGLPVGSGYEIIKLNALKESHRKGTRKHRSEYCTLYINENKSKFRILKSNPPKNVIRPDVRLTVDTPHDLIAARQIYNHFKKTKEPTRLFKIITFLDKNPKLLEFSRNVKMKNFVWI